MDIARVSVLWSGFSGGPGYSNFYFSRSAGFWDGGLIGDEAQIAAESAHDRVHSAFGDIRGIIPSDVTLTVESEIAIIDSDSGEIVGVTDVDSKLVGGVSASGGYSGPSGAVVNWRTNDYRFGRRIRGRTFLVPLASSVYQDDGSLTSDALRDLRDFGSAMVSGGSDPEFGVWSRPRDGEGGVFASVVSSNVPDMSAVLRSRRD